MRGTAVLRARSCRSAPARVFRPFLASYTRGVLDSRAMIGRREELAAFEAACTAVQEGAGRCVLVTGEAGIGKTWLATTALTHAGLATYGGAARSSVAQ